MTFCKVKPGLMLSLASTIIMLITSCATIGDKLLNPYSSNFQCPLTDVGECIKLKDAYDKSLKGVPPGEITLYRESEKIMRSEESSSFSLYQESMYKKLTDLLIEPDTPIVIAPRVVRVLFLPYKSSDNMLMMPRYTYFFIDEPQWVLGNYLSGGVE